MSRASQVAAAAMSDGAGKSLGDPQKVHGVWVVYIPVKCFENFFSSCYGDDVQSIFFGLKDLAFCGGAVSAVEEV